jgi:hypothetical protein
MKWIRKIIERNTVNIFLIKQEIRGTPHFSSILGELIGKVEKHG